MCNKRRNMKLFASCLIQLMKFTCFLDCFLLTMRQSAINSMFTFIGHSTQLSKRVDVRKKITKRNRNYPILVVHLSRFNKKIFQPLFLNFYHIFGSKGYHQILFIDKINFVQPLKYVCRSLMMIMTINLWKNWNLTRIYIL